MFPLPDVFLFPGQLLPLHVFEPRYRQMIEDLLDGPGRIVIATVHEDQRNELAGNPRVLSIAGLGSIERHERTEDDRFLIWLVGLTRVRIREIECDRLYRRVEYEPILEPTVPAATADSLRGRVIGAIEARAGQSVELGERVPLGVLADILAQCIRMPQSSMEPIYSEADPAARARAALEADQRY